MLGNLIESSLKQLGITSERVEAWTGRPCNCKERREKINQLEAWARRVARGKIDQARNQLDQILSQAP